MNKKLIIGIAVVIVVVAGFFVFKGKGSDQRSDIDSSSVTKNEQVTDTNESNFSQSNIATLQEAYESGDSLKCTIEIAPEITPQKFEYYFKGGDIRSKSSTRVSDTLTIEQEQIIKKNIAYTWVNTSSDIVATITDPKILELTRNAVFGLDAMLKSSPPNTTFICNQIDISDRLFDKP